MESVFCFHPKKTEIGLHSKSLRDISTLSHFKEYYAMTIAMKYGLPIFIAILMNLMANIFLLVDIWLMMIMISFLMRVMKISLVKA